MKYLKDSLHLIQKALFDFGRDDAATMASAIAFQAVLSLIPLLLLLIVGADLFLLTENVDNQVYVETEKTIGTDAAMLIDEILRSNNAQDWNDAVPASITIAALLFFASGMFHQLKLTLNVIWGVQPGPQRRLRHNVLIFFLNRVVAFVVVISVSSFLLIIVIVNAVIDNSAAGILKDFPYYAFYLPVIRYAITPLFLVVLFAMMYRFLPDATVAWRDVWFGAIITTMLFTFGEWLIQIYLDNILLATFYGAASTFIIILLWIYYSSIVILFGAELTKVYANRFGSRILPVHPLRPFADKSS